MIRNISGKFSGCSRASLFMFFLAAAIFTGPAAAAPRYGVVRDYNRATKRVTVETTSPAAFLPGKKLYIYRGRKQAAVVRIDMAFHSKVQCTFLSGSPIRKGSLALLSPGDVNRIAGLRVRRVSYRNVGSDGRSWIGRLSFSGTGEKVQPQVRKFSFSHYIGIKLKGKNYYSPVEIKKVRDIVYQWNPKNQKPEGRYILFYNGRKITCSEIITPSFLSRAKPSVKFRDKPVTMSLRLMKPSGMLKKPADAVPVKVNFPQPQKILKEYFSEQKKGEHLMIKVYSNALFIREFVLTSQQLRQRGLEKEFFIRGINLFPGNNNIEIFIVKASESRGEYFEEAAPKRVGNKRIHYSQEETRHKIEVYGADELQVR